MFNFGTPIGKLNMIGGECKATTTEQHKKIYNEIAKDYAKRHNAPYVHIFENGKFVDTICTKNFFQVVVENLKNKFKKNKIVNVVGACTYDDEY